MRTDRLLTGVRTVSGSALRGGPDGPTASPLAERLRDRRGEHVVFLSHCLLDENTRYLGGAGRPGCVREIVDACADTGVGMVQLPCPEQHAWGGVRKRRLLAIYGSARWLPTPLRRALLPLMLAYTRRVYRRLSRDAARQIRDYRRSGVDVLAVVGVDGSPSCGVGRTLDIPSAVDGLARVDRRTVDSAAVNAVVRATVVPGPGLFTASVRRQLHRRRIDVPFLAHDLQGELDGLPSTVGADLRRMVAEGPRSRPTHPDSR